MGDLTKDFSRLEMKCSCCGFFIEDKKLMKKLQKLRNAVGVPIKINSGCRCVSHNAEVGGSNNSPHLMGHAADISCRDMFLLRRHAYMIFDRIGIAKDYIHVDCDETKVQLTDWFY